MKDQKFPLRPASREEAGLFYSNDERDEALGTVGHLRMDFGSGGKGFYHTWWPHNEDRFNTPEFKEALQEFVDAMRQSGPLKNLAAMNTYCWHNGGEIAENDRVYGFISETEHYRFCLRCTPRSGDYQGYLYCYDLRQQEMARQDKLVGRVSYASGEKQEFTDAGQYLQTIREELPYWQASGESLKTSIRTKTRLGQIVQEGRFRGGTPAYGFQLVKKGRTGKKNRELYDIEINPDEAFAVKRMFDLTDRYGYGGRKISTILKNEGIINLRTGEPFHYSTIQHILANIMNAGILRSGETQSDVFPELQIIPLEQFQRVTKAREQRSINYAIKCGWETEKVTLEDGNEATVVRSSGSYPRKIVGKALLSGNVYCGHCGGRVFATTARKAHHPSDHPERIAIYKCYNRTQHKEQCDGPTTYRAEKVDSVVESILRGIFERAKRVDEKEFLKAQVQISNKEYQQKLKLAKAEYSKATKELSKWEELMLASIEGTCVFTPEQVKKRMDIAQEKVDGLSKEIEMLQIGMSEAKTISSEILAQHQQLLSWAELFDSASIDEKKVISSQMIKAVTLTRNYGIQIEFNISEAQFLNGMEMG